MAFDAHKNLAITAVATAPSPATTGTSLVVSAGEGARMPAVPFNATVWPTGATPTPANAEIVRVTARSTDTLTITRAQESSTARTVVVGDLIAATVTAKTLTDVETQAALLAAANIFTATPQQIGPVATPALVWYDAAPATDNRIFRVKNAGQLLIVDALNDTQAAVLSTPLALTRGGDVWVGRDLYEKARAAPVGHWVNVPSNGGLFTTVGGGGVSLTTYLNQAYTLVGKTLTYAIYVQLTLTGAPLAIKIALPGGMVTAQYQGTAFAYGTATGMMAVLPADTGVFLYTNATGALAWTAGTYYMVGTLAFEIQ